MHERLKQVLPPAASVEIRLIQLVLLLMAGVSLVLMLLYVQFKAALEQSQLEAAERQAQRIQLSLDSWLDNQITSLQVLAATADEPVTDAGPIRFVSAEPERLAAGGDRWVTDALHEGTALYLGINTATERPHWRLAIQASEDAGKPAMLVAEPSLALMLTQLQLSERFGVVSVWAAEIGAPLLQSARADVNTVTVERLWPRAGLRLIYELEVPPGAVQSSGLQMTQFLPAIALMLLIATGGCWLGRRWLIAPLREFANATSALAAGNTEPVRQLRSQLCGGEWQRLVRDLRDIAAAVYRRERALKTRNRQLETLTEGLYSQQAQMIRSERMASIGTLSAGVAHEINNPLGFLKSNLETLQGYARVLLGLLECCQQNRKDVEQVKQLAAFLNHAERHDDLAYIQQDLVPMLEESLEGSARIQSVVQGLMTFSDDGTATHLLDLNDCVKVALSILKSDLDCRAQLTLELQPLPEIRGVSSQLNQVMFNVIRNAIQALPEHGEINVRSAVIDGEVVVSVRDNGVGIEETELGRLFTPFYTTRPVGQGVGLGLSISDNIIERHYGRLEVDSTPGAGSEFRIILPAVNRTDTTSEAVKPAEAVCEAG